MNSAHGSLRSRLGLAQVWSGVVACPCHWPLLLVGLFGGTALGGVVRTHFMPVFAGTALYFALAVGLGYWVLRRGSGKDCAECQTSGGSMGRSSKEV